MKEIIERGATALVLHLFVPDAGSSTGAGKTGLTATSAGLVIGIIRSGDAVATSYTASADTIESITQLGTYEAPSSGKCRFREIDSQVLPGWYELQFADALFSATGGRRSLGGMLWGAAGTLPVPFQIQLCDPARGVGSPANLDVPVSSRSNGADFTAARAARLDLLDVAVSTRGDATALNQVTLLARLGAFTGTGLNTVLGFLRALLRKDPGLTPGDVGGTFDNTSDSLEARADLPAPATTLSANEHLAIADALLDRANGIETGESPRETLRLVRAACVGKSTGSPFGPVAFRDRADTKNRITALVDPQGNRTSVTTDST